MIFKGATLAIGLRFIVLMPFLLCASCDDAPKDNAPSTTQKIIEGRLGNASYFVPAPYFIFEERAFDDDGIYIHTVYPSFAPPAKAPNEYWRDGQSQNYIRILAQHYPELELSEADLLRKITAWEDAYQISGDEYGLLHQTQPEGYNKDKKDIWVEKRGDEVLSIIMCSEKLTESDIPQCSQHYYLDGELHMKVNFDKRLLPEWKKIDSGIRELFESFREKDSAENIIYRDHNQRLK